MQNDFIEELRRKTKIAEEEYKKKIKQKQPWISDAALDEKVFINTLSKMFNPKNIKKGEER